MTVTGGLESLAARCQRATVHGLTVQRADVAMVRLVRGKVERLRRRFGDGRSTAQVRFCTTLTAANLFP